VGLQDTGAAVRNAAAKAKGMTACACRDSVTASAPLGEQFVLLALDERWRNTDCECWRYLLRQGMTNTLLTCGTVVIVDEIIESFAQFILIAFSLIFVQVFHVLYVLRLH